MKKILISGANSYIGTSLDKYLAYWPNEYQVDTLDLIQAGWQNKSFIGYDCVFHVAGIAHINTRKLTDNQRDQYWKVNADLPYEVAEKAKIEGVGQFIFLSSMSVYGEIGKAKTALVISKETPLEPKDIYGESKLHAEKKLSQLQDGRFSLVILRPPMIYGPGCKGNYPQLSRFARRFPVFPRIDNQRSMLFIDNLCMFVKAIIDDVRNGVFLPQNREYVCVSNLVGLIAREHNKRIILTRLFNPLLKPLIGRIGIITKLFGGIVYARFPQTEDVNAKFVGLEESIRITENMK